jgi:HTH-type transcriptional regulator/antitoxin HipB
VSQHYPLRFSDQLRQHLRALRKRRGLTQAQLGSMVGVSQARIAEIEANPGLVNFDQILQLLATLGATLRLEDNSPVLYSDESEHARTPELQVQQTAAVYHTQPARPSLEDDAMSPVKRSRKSSLPPTQSDHPGTAPVPSAHAKKGVW